MTGPAAIAAIGMLAKINAVGRWIAPEEQVSLHQLFERMTRNELELYARDGELPSWFIDITKRGGTHSPL